MDEIVRHGENGFMVAPYAVEAICRHTLNLADDLVLRRKMGNASRRFALDHFAAEQCAALHHAAYRAACGDKNALREVLETP